MTARERLVVGVGAIVILGTLGGRQLLPAGLSWSRTVGAEAMARSHEVVETRASLAGLPSVVGSLEARRERFVALRDRFVGGTDPSAAGSALSAWIAAHALRSGAVLRSVSVRPDSAAPDNPLGSATVEVELAASAEALARLLLAFEGAAELVSMRTLDVARAQHADSPGTLQVRLTAESLYVRRAAGGQAGD